MRGLAFWVVGVTLVLVGIGFCVATFALGVNVNRHLAVVGFSVTDLDPSNTTLVVEGVLLTGPAMGSQVSMVVLTTLMSQYAVGMEDSVLENLCCAQLLDVTGVSGCTPS